jgi:hypothetical protein
MNPFEIPNASRTASTLPTTTALVRRPSVAKRKTSDLADASTDTVELRTHQRKRSRTVTRTDLALVPRARSGSVVSQSTPSGDARLPIALQRIDSLKQRITQLEGALGKLEDEKAAVTLQHAADVSKLEEEVRGLQATKAQLEKSNQEWAGMAMTFASSANAAQAALAGAATGAQAFPDVTAYSRLQPMQAVPEFDPADLAQAHFKPWPGY